MWTLVLSGGPLVNITSIPLISRGGGAAHFRTKFGKYPDCSFLRYLLKIHRFFQGLLNFLDLVQGKNRIPRTRQESRIGPRIPSGLRHQFFIT
jgi:hypothetical protein